jgi:type IV secretion system protein VirB11
MVLQSGSQLRREDVVSYVERAVDIFVQLERRDGRRWISQVEWKAAGPASLPIGRT